MILTGPPGVGKTTVARLLAELSDRAVHLESNRFFKFIAVSSGNLCETPSQQAVSTLFSSCCVRPLELALERASGRDASRLSDPAVVEQLWSAFSNLGELEGHVLDNGGQTAEETAREVLRHLSITSSP